MDIKTFNVRVDKQTHNKMKVLAARLDIGMSSLIRKAVEEIIKRHEAEHEKGVEVKSRS